MRLILCVRGTLPYMAPELVSDPTRVSEKADVWSLGMVLWEMLTLQVPFSDLSPQQIVAGLMVGNLQPPVRYSRKVFVVTYGLLCFASSLNDVVLMHLDLKCNLDFQHIKAGFLAACALALQIPEWCESSWQSLLEACWEVSPSARPHLRDLVRFPIHLERVLSCGNGACRCVCLCKGRSQLLAALQTACRSLYLTALLQAFQLEAILQMP